MPPPPPVSSTRTVIDSLPSFTLLAEILYLRGVVQPCVSPTFVPLTHVTSSSSIGPSERLRSLPDHAAGISTTLRNQTTPSKFGRPASSQCVGSSIVFQSFASKAGSCQFAPLFALTASSNAFFHTAIFWS